MKENFEKSLALLLKSEGGYVNHPADPGGRTNLGVTQRVWESYIERSATEEDMRNLTPAMVAPLYRQRYWDTCRCDELPGGLDYLAFDFSVNAGAARCIKTIQKSLNVHPDGVIGPITLQAIKNAEPDEFVANFSAAKETFYRGLATFGTFGKGWLNRVAESQKTAEGMLA